jgi:hypothetical protein
MRNDPCGVPPSMKRVTDFCNLYLYEESYVMVYLMMAVEVESNVGYFCLLYG